MSQWISIEKQQQIVLFSFNVDQGKYPPCFLFQMSKARLAVKIVKLKYKLDEALARIETLEQGGSTTGTSGSQDLQAALDAIADLQQQVVILCIQVVCLQKILIL